MLLISFFNALALAGVAALIAIVYRYILLGEPILHWFLKWGEQHADKWFFAIIWGCHKCMAGQLALWLFLITHYNPSHVAQIGAQRIYFGFTMYFPSYGVYSFMWHIFTIYAAILISELLKTKIIDKL